MQLFISFCPEQQCQKPIDQYPSALRRYFIQISSTVSPARISTCRRKIPQRIIYHLHNHGLRHRTSCLHLVVIILIQFQRHRDTGKIAEAYRMDFDIPCHHRPLVPAQDLVRQIEHTLPC